MMFRTRTGFGPGLSGYCVFAPEPDAFARVNGDPLLADRECQRRAVQYNERSIHTLIAREQP